MNSDIAVKRDGVVFERLTDNVWMHTSYEEVAGAGLVPSNGLVVIDGTTAILIDTGWNDDQTDTILDWAERDLKHPVDRAVFTHAHSDKMGGVQTVKARGIATYAHPLSNRIAPEKALTPAEFDLSFNAVSVADTWGVIEVLYPGPGHTEDNIVVYVHGTGIVFGGCLVRPSGARTLGNTADASLVHWDESVLRVAEAFPTAQTVVPSHGPPAGVELLGLTVELVRSANANAASQQR